MQTKTHAQTTNAEPKQDGCCCGLSAGTPKISAVEHGAKPAPVKRENATKDTSSGQSKGCCGAH